MRTAIVTDSNSGIDAQTARLMHISIVPMPILIHGEIYYEGRDLGDAAFFNALQTNTDISTSMPSPGDVKDLWDSLLNDEGYDELLYIPMSSGLSSSCEMAKSMAIEYCGRVVVADIHRISVTQYSAVMHAAKLCCDGLSASAIAAVLERNAFRSKVYLAVDDISFLKRGGRISQSAATLGGLLHVKPVLTILGQRIEPFTKAHGMKSAVKTMLRLLHQDAEALLAENAATLNIGVAASGISDDELESLLAHLRREFPTAVTFSAKLPYSICVHTGLGAIGYGISQEL